MTQVFISYSRKNLAFVNRLAHDLQAAGMDVWYDLSNLDGGVQWVSEIQSAIQKSQYIIVVLSPDSVQSKWVEREILFAEGLELKIIPILIQPCDLPIWTIDVQSIDMQGENYDLRLKELRKALNIEEQIETSDKIDCIVLCGGYSRRLMPLTRDISKVLLPVAGKPMLEYAIDFVQKSSMIRKTILSVNQKFASQIQTHVEYYQSKEKLNHPIEVVVEPSKEQKEKLGPVGALQYIISQSSPRDLLVLGGDNIFSFRLDEFLGIIPRTGETCSYNAVYEYQDQMQNNSEFGTVELDQNGDFVSFIEKPAEVLYKNISTACYFFKKRDVEEIYEYLQAGGDPDSLGNFVHWLVRKRRIKSFLFPTYWFDIGTREALIQANMHFLTHSISKTVEMRNSEYIEPIHIEANCKISNSKLGPSVYIGQEVQIINSSISNSIILDRCIVTGSEIKDCVVGAGSLIEEGHIYEGVYGTKK